MRRGKEVGRRNGREREGREMGNGGKAWCVTDTCQAGTMMVQERMRGLHIQGS